MSKQLSARVRERASSETFPGSLPKSAEDSRSNAVRAPCQRSSGGDTGACEPRGVAQQASPIGARMADWSSTNGTSPRKCVGLSGRPPPNGRIHVGPPIRSKAPVRVQMRNNELAPPQALQGIRVPILGVDVQVVYQCKQ